MGTAEPADTHDGAIAAVEQQFAAVFVRARRATRQRAAAVHPDLTVLGFHVLSVLARTGSRTQSELVGILSTDKAMMSRTISHLAGLDLIEKTPDPQDGRVQLLALSSRGRRRFEALKGTERRRLHERLHEWELADVRTLARLLERINDEVWEAPTPPR